MPARETAPQGAPCWIDLVTSDPAGARDLYGLLFEWTFDGGDDYTYDDVDRIVALTASLGGCVTDAAQDSPYGRFAGLADPTGVQFKVMTPSEWQLPT